MCKHKNEYVARRNSLVLLRETLSKAGLLEPFSPLNEKLSMHENFWEWQIDQESCYVCTSLAYQPPECHEEVEQRSIAKIERSVFTWEGR